MNKLAQVTFLITLELSAPLYALPFTFEVEGVNPIGYPSRVGYTITNNTDNATVLIKYLPPNVEILGTNTTCATTRNTQFIVNKGQSCLLNLTVSGPVSNQDANPINHLTICLSDRASCASPNPEQSLNISGTPLPVRTVFTTVGDYQSGSNTLPVGFTTSDNGVNWRVSSTTLPILGSAILLNGVACASDGTSCIAVGSNHMSATPASAANPLIYRSSDGGENWSLPDTQPSPLNSNRANRLNSVACSSTGELCTTVGFYNNNVQNTPLSYFSTDAGATWTASVTQPPPVTGGTQSNILTAVACSSNGLSCTSVGSYDNATGSPNYTRSLSYTSSDGGNIWTVSTTLPPDVFGSQNSLSSVACSADGQRCTAVGSYRASIGGGIFVFKPITYVSTNAGVTWSGSTAQPQYLGNNVSRLASISCDRTGLKCTAVGFYFDGANLPLSYYSNNGGNTWSVSTTLPPAQGIQDELQSVKCDEQMLSCLAIGRSNNGTRFVPVSYTSTDEGNTWVISNTLPPAQGISSANNFLSEVG